MFILLKQKPMFYSASAKAISSAAAIMSSRDCGFADMSLKSNSSSEVCALFVVGATASVGFSSFAIVAGDFVAGSNLVIKKSCFTS